MAILILVVIVGSWAIVDEIAIVKCASVRVTPDFIAIVAAIIFGVSTTNVWRWGSGPVVVVGGGSCVDVTMHWVVGLFILLTFFSFMILVGIARV